MVVVCSGLFFFLSLKSHRSIRLDWNEIPMEPTGVVPQEWIRQTVVPPYVQITRPLLECQFLSQEHL